MDDSADGSLVLGDGVRVLKSFGRGPYAARNIGWRASDADVVLFLDVRSRPHGAWARRLSEAFKDSAVAVASSDVIVRGGRTLGARAGERHQFFLREKYSIDGFFRPYAPTCNLGVRRADLAAVDGFEEVRSGADADLCWRILAGAERRLECLPEPLMEWVPRDSLIGYFEQSYRYGKSNYTLRRRWESAGAPQERAFPYRYIARRSVRVLAQAAKATLVNRDSVETLELVRLGGWLAFHLGYRVAVGAGGRSGLSRSSQQ